MSSVSLRTGGGATHGERGVAGHPTSQRSSYGAKGGARNAARGAVLHYVERWLPASEGFVHDVISNLRRPGVVVARRALENADRFPCSETVSLSSFVDRTPERFRQKATTLALLGVAWHVGASLVHVHHGYGVEQVLGLVRRRRLPLVVSFHGHDLTGHLAAYPNTYNRARELTSAVVVPSRFLAGLALDAGFDPQVVHVIPAGVDTRYFVPSPLPEPGGEVLFVGRFVEKKGLDVLARAWPVVAAQVPGARLRLLGFGPLESLARSIPGLVEVVVAPRREEVRDAMRRATVVVSPSHVADEDAVESMLVVNLEAQASGRPVVTTRHGGIPEFVADGETALLVREGDHHELARAVIRVLSDRELAHRLGGAGPLLARRFDVRAMAAKMEELYDWLGEHGAGPCPRAGN